MTLDEIRQGGSEGDAIVRVRNASDSACTSGGYVGLQFLDAAKKAEPTNVQRLGPSSPVFPTGTSPTPFTLTPGQYAYFIVDYALQNSGGSSCSEQAIFLGVIPPNETQQLIISGRAPSGLYVTTCDGNAGITPLEPGRGWS
jgi:hypothetical protein